MTASTPGVCRAAMRSRRADVDPALALQRALDLGLVGLVGLGGPVRAVRGRYRRGTITGRWHYDSAAAAYAADLVQVRGCRWGDPLDEHRVPAAVVATFRRAGAIPADPRAGLTNHIPNTEEPGRLRVRRRQARS